MPRRAAAYLVGLVVPAAVGLAVHDAADTQPFFPGIWMLVGIVVATLLGGTGPALTGLVVSVVTLWWAVLEPQGSLAVSRPTDVLGLVGFAVATALVAATVAQLNRSVHQTLEAAEAEARAERRAAASAAVLDALVQSAPVGFAFVDPALRFVLVNEQLAQFNGVSVADHLGRPVAEVVPDLADETTRLFRHVLQSGEPLVDVELEAMTPGSDGERRHWLVNYYPVRVDGGIVGVGATVVDVTDRRILEDIRREAQAARATSALAQQLEEAQRIAHIGSWTWFPAGDRLTWSTELHRMFGIDPADPIRHADDMARRVPGIRPELVADLAAAITAADDGFEREVEVPVGSDVRLITLRGEPFRSTDGEAGYRGTAQDVTEQRRAQVALARTREELLVADLERRRVQATVEALQHAVLPEHLPRVPGFQLTAGYEPAGAGTEFGGDWYDAFVVDDELVVVVGDVAGHGLPAAAVMAQLRNALRAFGHEDPDPASALARLNRLMCLLDEPRFGTAIMARCRPDGSVTWCRAGHPPPVRFGNGDAELLPLDGGGMLLGIDPGAPYGETVTRLDPADSLLLFTDGLVERRDRDIDDGFDALIDEFAKVTGPAEVADAVDRLAAEHEDDICYVAIRRVSPNS